MVAAGALFAIVACASQNMRASQQAMPAAPVAGGAASSPHDQIEALAQQIETDRGSLKLPTTISASAPPATCVRNPSATCTQTCKLSDSICDNAKKICDIATTELANDDWAQKKCTENRSTCSVAAQQCCECVP
jgi:hypothetical protein